MLYGGALRSGYGTMGYLDFSTAYVPAALLDFARWLALLLPAVLLILPLAIPSCANFATASSSRSPSGLAP